MRIFDRIFRASINSFINNSTNINNEKSEILDEKSLKFNPFYDRSGAPDNNP